MNGVIVVNKPKGITSRDVVNKLVKVFGTKSIGHIGTLDPMATGVLVCLIGKYTKLGSIMVNHDKEYIATFKLNVLTDTLDIEGKVLDTDDKKISLEDMNGAIEHLMDLLICKKYQYIQQSKLMVRNFMIMLEIMKMLFYQKRGNYL